MQPDAVDLSDRVPRDAPGTREIGFTIPRALQCERASVRQYRSRVWRPPGRARTRWGAFAATTSFVREACRVSGMRSRRSGCSAATAF